MGRENSNCADHRTTPVVMAASAQLKTGQRRVPMRDNGVMDLEEAHWRLSAYSAQTAGLTDRGYTAEGMPADIVVYDLDALALLPSERVADWPGGAWHLDRRAQGWRWTIVNGAVTFEDGTCTGATPGRLLRHGHA